MSVKLDVIETNVPEITGIVGSIIFRDDALCFPASSTAKLSQIKLGAIAELLMLDSDKYFTTAKFDFGDGKYLIFKADTDLYLKHIKHKRFNKTQSLEVTEHVSALTVGVGIFCALIALSMLTGGNEKSAITNSSQNVSVESTSAAQTLIKRSGYRCDSVSFIHQSSWDGSYRVTCNDDYYAYSITDIGGNWVVKVE